MTRAWPEAGTIVASRTLAYDENGRVRRLIGAGLQETAMKAEQRHRSQIRTLGMLALLIDVSVAIGGDIRELPFPDGTRTYPGALGSRIEYCPDDTCTVFSAVGSAVLDTLSQYAFLYLYEYGDFYALDAFRDQVALSKVTAIVKETECEFDSGHGDRSSGIDCALMLLEP